MDVIAEQQQPPGNKCSPGARPSRDAQGIHSRQPSLAVPELPSAQDTAGPQACEVPSGLFAGLVFREEITQGKSPVGADIHAAVQPGACSAEWDFSRGSVRLEVPERIQRRRSKGSRQPPNTRYCGRPTRWGNPFPIGEEYTRTESLDAFRNAFWACELSVTPERVRAELAAYDYLSCWCRPEQECHVDEYIKAIHDGRRPSAI